MATNVTSEADLQACYLDATEDYTVTADITLTGAFTAYQITSYSGTFDGGNYTIADLIIVTTANRGGLFRSISGGIVQDINITSADISTIHYYVGIVCGVLSSGTIDNCTTSGQLVGTNFGRHGGICGCMIGGTIQNCINNATISGFTVGGIAGYIATSGTMLIDSCINTGEIISGYACDHHGGILAYCYGANTTINNCTNTGNIGYSGSSLSSYTGGIGGRIKSIKEITNCTNTGNVKSASLYVGGISGYHSGGMDNCISTGTVYSTNLYVGGAIGALSVGTITNSSTNSTVIGGDTTGGFIGYVFGAASISNCFSEGSVDGASINKNLLGGFTGNIKYASAVIDNCYSTANVGTNVVAGGKVGSFSGGLYLGTIKRCYCTGDTGVSSSISRGGFCGLIKGGTAVISDCYSTGANNSTGLYRGMFVGWNRGTISNCGCKNHATIRDVGYPAGDVTYSKADPTEWYSKDEAIYTDGTYPWSFY